jgi:hypothetical protein
MSDITLSGYNATTGKLLDLPYSTIQSEIDRAVSTVLPPTLVTTDSIEASLTITTQSEVIATSDPVVELNNGNSGNYIIVNNAAYIGHPGIQNTVISLGEDADVGANWNIAIVTPYAYMPPYGGAPDATVTFLNSSGLPLTLTAQLIDVVVTAGNPQLFVYSGIPVGNDVFTFGSGVAPYYLTSCYINLSFFGYGTDINQNLLMAQITNTYSIGGA